MKLETESETDLMVMLDNNLNHVKYTLFHKIMLSSWENGTKKMQTRSVKIETTTTNNWNHDDDNNYKYIQSK